MRYTTGLSGHWTISVYSYRTTGLWGDCVSTWSYTPIFRRPVVKFSRPFFLHFIKCRQSKLRFLEHLRAIVRMMRRRSSSSKKVIWASPGNHLRGIWVSFSYSPLDNWFRRKWKKVSFFSRYCSKKWCVKMWLILFFGLLVFKISIRKKMCFFLIFSNF